MRLAPALVLIAAVMETACCSLSAGPPVDVLLPSASASPAQRPPIPPLFLVSPPRAPVADPQWKHRCAAFVQQGLVAASAVDPALAAALVEVEECDAVSSRNLMGFGIDVRRKAPDVATRDAPGIWQHRAESFHGSYHVLFVRDTGAVTATMGFDGWPSPRVEPLVPVLQGALDRCFAGRG